MKAQQRLKETVVTFSVGQLRQFGFQYGRNSVTRVVSITYIQTCESTLLHDIAVKLRINTVWGA
jgi:hypothetical protein